MIEAELKARLDRPDSVRAALARFSPPEKSIYSDVYYDAADDSFERTGRELRLRTITSPQGMQHLLTYKEGVVDRQSGSKPEYETGVSTPDATAYIIQELGYRPTIALTKHCENYRFSHEGREFLATIVLIPEITGTFLEVETIAEVQELAGALAAVRSLLQDLGVSERELTTELYTDAVRSARQ